jgi:predicted ATPase
MGSLRFESAATIGAGLGLRYPFFICSLEFCMVAAPMRPRSVLSSPFLRSIELQHDRVAAGEFPFTLPFFTRGEFRIEFKRPITFLVGENGSGKSTLLEALAAHCGFHSSGGSRDHVEHRGEDRASPARVLAGALRFGWKPKVTHGFFFRAESFFQVATRLDAHSPGSYGGHELHAQSHGESFLSLFLDRFGDERTCIYLMDEPEAALSPERQLAFLALLHRWHGSGRVQAIIATHAPMLMAYPEATLLSLDGSAIEPIALRDTNHYRRMKSFLDEPERYIRAILDVEEEEAGDQ